MRMVLTIAVMLAGSVASTVGAQVVEPENNLHVLVNGAFDLCPTLVKEGDGATFDPVPYGMKASDRREGMWESQFQDGFAFMVVEHATRECSLNFAGPETAMAFLSQFMQETMVENSFVKLDIENPTSRPGSVHVRLNEDMTRREQYTVVEGSELLTITYTEKANF